MSPFIKLGAFERLMASIRPGVHVKCYTRWHPDEIAAGVSDLSIWPFLRERKHSLYLCSQLHAKAYATETDCLVGSANLTNAGLGWSSASNLEIMVRTARSSGPVVALEDQLRRLSISASDVIYESFLHIPVNVAPVPDATEWEHKLTSAKEVKWLPRCRYPGSHNLYRTFKGRWESVSKTTFDDAQRDLDFLEVPSSINTEQEFGAFVAARLSLLPIVQDVRSRARQGITDPEGMDLVARYSIAGNGPDGSHTGDEWECLRTWLATFLSNEFRIRTTASGVELVRSVRLK
ncbi:phospholipase D family protein [Gordonia amicalis]|nr:phospholipase D family protein [Gordonia amicalis]UPW14574.1 phospholipase D family protein [Gordonia amicalis]